MNRIDILVCTELFNIRKRKEYPKQIIKDIYDEINHLFGIPFMNYDVVDSYSSFKRALKENYISRSPLEYKYVCSLLSYLDNFALVQKRCKDW